MTAPLLSATLIVRDEEANLGACLGSIAPIAAEVVVVDTGSSDATVAIANAHGARVVHHPWGEDFAEARNVALEHAHGDWILYVDADERLRPADSGEVAKRLRTAPEAAFRIHLRPFEHSTPYLEYRLWRADSGIRFRGVIHEQVVDDIHRIACRDGRPISDWPALELDHVGYGGDQAAKHRRNLPLLRRQLEADPANVFNWCHLARVLHAAGDSPGAEQALERAVALARSEATASNLGSLAWGDLVRLKHERGADVGPLLAEGKARWPENWQLVWVEGNIHLDAGRLEEAAACFRRLLEVDISGLAKQDLAYDERIFGSFAQSSLGLALFRAERYSEAAEAYAAAARLEPASREHRAKLALCEVRARRQCDSRPAPRNSEPPSGKWS